LAINHQREFSGTPSCDEFTIAARSIMGRVTPPLLGGHPNDTRRLRSRGPAASGTGVDDDAASTTPIAVTAIVTDLRRELDN
jgi:hypothetical protein